MRIRYTQTKQYFIDSNDQQILTIFKAKVTQNLTGRSVTGGPIPPTPDPPPHHNKHGHCKMQGFTPLAKFRLVLHRKTDTVVPHFGHPAQCIKYS